MRRTLALLLLALCLTACSKPALDPVPPPPAPGDPIPGPTPPPAPPVSQPDPQPQPKPPEPVLVTYTGPVEHIFFHPLIAFPELAFDGDGLSAGYDDWFVTVPEFNRILTGLHAKGYILIGMDDLFAVSGNDLSRRELRLPEGKKPLIISVDDINYYKYMRENGNVYKLVLDEQQQIATYSITPAGEPLTSYDNELVPILDRFVQEHPDFSWHGAKGILALTGYEGILGYRTNTGDPAEKEAALKVVQRLKETGWSFASHSWGHLDMAKVSYATFVRDTDRWKNEVEPLIGRTLVYIYPFGSAVPEGGEKFRYLLDQGFRIFCSVGPTPYEPSVGKYVTMERRHIDGFAFRLQRKSLLHLFDAAEVIDRDARPAR